MGGLGALSYPARHPGIWKAAFSFSGIVDTLHTKGATKDLVAELKKRGVDLGALWGDPGRDPADWRSHNPYDLIARMHDVPVYLSAGDGSRGPRREVLFRQEAEAYAARARASGMDVTTDFGVGGHLWPDFDTALGRAMPWICQQLGVPPPKH